MNRKFTLSFFLGVSAIIAINMKCMGQFMGSDEDGYSEFYYTEILNFGSIYGGGAGSDFGFFVLPVSLYEFYGNCASNGIDLRWSTASELNNDYFELSRSLNGSDWAEVKRMGGAGTTNREHQYSFFDFITMAESDRVYYKLASYDFDGSYHTGKLISVQCDNYGLGIYPNPSSDKIYVPMIDDDLIINYQLYSSSAVVVKAGIGQRKNSHQALEILINDLPTGVYTLVVTSNRGARSEKIVKE